MSSKVSSFDNVKIGDFSYLFLIVSWNDYASNVANELEKHFDSFGQDLALKGEVLKPYSTASYDVAESVLSKNWPENLKVKLADSQDPFMLIINTDYNDFDPQQHLWGIVWFSDFVEKPERIYRVFSRLAHQTRKDEDIFTYLRSLNRKKSLKKWINYFEIKPKLFGIAVDVNAIFEDTYTRITGIKE
jgi:hypothetical protein